MTETDIRGAVFRVLKAIAPETDPSAIGDNERLRAAIDLDSFDFLNLMVGLKRETGVDIPESDYGQVSTMASLVHYLLARAATAPPRTNAGGRA